MIELKDLSISLQSNLILKDINYIFDHQGLYRIQGANGAGKSTLIELIAGAEFETTGAIHRLKEATISFLPQIAKNNPKIYLELKDICSKSFDFYPSQMFNKPWHLSSEGERKKALIARALSNDVKIYLLDEPFNHLDNYSCQSIGRYLEELSKTKLVIYVSHEFKIENTTDVELAQWK